METITGKIKVSETVKATVSVKQSITGSLTLKLPDIEKYTGSYTVIPSRSKQILKTKNKISVDNITIEPIPKNYGLIEWNGSFIKVS